MTAAGIVVAMIGRDERVADIGGPRKAYTGETVLEASGLDCDQAIATSSFTPSRGEILGLYGLVGAGRTELARAILGNGRITGGEVRRQRASRRASARWTSASRSYRIGYVSEDRKGEGLLLAHPVRNIAITVWRRVASRFGLAGSGERSRQTARATA